MHRFRLTSHQTHRKSGDGRTSDRSSSLITRFRSDASADLLIDANRLDSQHDGLSCFDVESSPALRARRGLRPYIVGPSGRLRGSGSIPIVSLSPPAIIWFIAVACSSPLSPATRQPTASIGGSPKRNRSFQPSVRRLLGEISDECFLYICLRPAYRCLGYIGVSWAVAGAGCACYATIHCV